MLIYHETSGTQIKCSVFFHVMTPVCPWLPWVFWTTWTAWTASWISALQFTRLSTLCPLNGNYFPSFYNCFKTHQRSQRFIMIAVQNWTVAPRSAHATSQNSLKNPSKIFQSHGVHKWIHCWSGHYKKPLNVPDPMNKDTIAICTEVDDINKNKWWEIQS